LFRPEETVVTESDCSLFLAGPAVLGFVWRRLSSVLKNYFFFLAAFFATFFATFFAAFFAGFLAAIVFLLD
jgi:hypothetical protein